MDIINQFDIVAVANVDEGVELRELGYEKEIFVLNQPYESEIEKIIKYNITVGISSYGFAEKLGETNKNVAAINDGQSYPEYFELCTKVELLNETVSRKKEELQKQGYLILEYAYDMHEAQKIADAYAYKIGLP